MINLYNPENSNFDKHGDVVLTPTECTITAELNGPWTLTVVHPIDTEGRWKSIVVGAVIKAPSFNGNQLFRIRDVLKSDGGVSASADPIFMDALGDCFIRDARPTNANGQQALTAILAANSKYSGTSDIETTSTAYFQNRNAIDVIAGTDSPTFLERWGGEVLFDNFSIIINERVGGDYGVRILYGKNIEGISEQINVDGVVTRIYPFSYNGYTLEGDGYIDSPLLSSYPTVHAERRDYEHIKLASDVTGEEPQEGDEVYATLEELRTALQNAANAEFSNGLDKPAIVITIDMVNIVNTTLYAGFKNIETVSLGDTVHCKHVRLGITTDARVVALEFDALREITTSVTLNSEPKSVFKELTSTIRAVNHAITPEGKVIAERIEGFIDGASAQLRLQNTIAKKQDVRALLFEDLDPDSPTFGALSIGTQGFQISRTRTADGRDWVWTTAATSEGIFADSIIAQERLAVAKHFFADDTGVHITEDEYDYTSGNNVFIDGDSVDIRQGETVLATFGESTRIGEEGKSGVSFNPTESLFYSGEGQVVGQIKQGPSETRTFYDTAIYSGEPVKVFPWSFSKVLTETPIAQTGEPLISLDVWIYAYSPTEGALHIQEADTDYTATFGTFTVTARYDSATNTLSGAVTQNGLFEPSIRIGPSYFANIPTPVFLFGTGLKATSENSFVIGKNNVDSGSLFIVGNGDAVTGDLNIFEVGLNGGVGAALYGDFSTQNGDLLLENINTPTITLKHKTYGATSHIKAYRANNLGNNLVIQAGGTFVAGGGEYPENRYSESLLTPISTREDAYFGADQDVYIESNGQTIANAKTWKFGASGILEAPSNIVLPNNANIGFLDTNGDAVNVLGYSSSNNVSLGYGNYSKSAGNTNIYSGANANVNAKGAIYLKTNATNANEYTWSLGNNGKTFLPGDLRISENSKAIELIGSDGETAYNAMTLNASNILAIGYGLYANNVGSTNVHGNAIELLSKNDIKLTTSEGARSWNDTNKTLYGNGSPDGQITSLANSSWTVIGSITIPKGVSLVHVAVRFANNSTGRRHVFLATNNNADSSGSVNVMSADYQTAVPNTYTMGKFTTLLNPTAQTTYYIKAWQNSGGALTVAPRVSAVQLR